MANQIGSVVALVDGTLRVNLGGEVRTVRYAGGYIPAAGDTVLVDVTGTAATVIDYVHRDPRPLTGTVVGTPSSGIAQVSTSAGTVAARYMGSPPSASSTVRLIWDAAEPWVLGVVTAFPASGGGSAAPAPPAPPRPKPKSGTLIVPAGWSGSWRPAPISKWLPDDVQQGAYGGGVAYQGIWGGYSQAKLKSLAGKTIVKAELKHGARLRIGSFNSALSAQFHRNASTDRGAPFLSHGPYPASIPANSGAAWVEIDTQIIDALKLGGSVALSGGSYGGVVGRSSDPYSGTLRIQWKA